MGVGTGGTAQFEGRRWGRATAEDGARGRSCVLRGSAWDVRLDLSGLLAPPAEGGWEGNGPPVVPSTLIRTQNPS